MQMKLKVLSDICAVVNRQIQDIYPALETMFIPHASGMLSEVAVTNDHDVLNHPAGRIALSIIDKQKDQDQSSFLGIAIHHDVKWFGLASKDYILALFNINIDEFSSPKDARRGIYNLVWHALDLMEVRKRPEYAHKFRSGPMIPKRSPMNLAHLNLQADIFSSVLCALQEDKNTIYNIARYRAMCTLDQKVDRIPEHYPFPIAYESTLYAFDHLQSLKPQKKEYMNLARQIALQVGRSFDDDHIINWWDLCKPSQEMAWRGFSKEQILGCAIYTCEDPFVRSTAQLVSELVDINPIKGYNVEDIYNPFINSDKNHKLHKEMIERNFEDAVTKGLSLENCEPLIAAANQQNESLTDGHFIGWCAHALQASARAFERALASGASPAQAARSEFDQTKDKTDWETLKAVSEEIVDKKRQGFGITLGTIAELCASKPGLDGVLNAVQTTMKDPSYINKLKAANELRLGLNTPGPKPASPTFSGPSTPTPSAPSLSAPVFAAAPAGPGGIGANAALAARQRAIQEHARKQKETDDTGSKTET